MKRKELEELLKYHDNLYYNQDSPEITDAEYDILKNYYVEHYGEYNYVPGKAMFKKFRHVLPIRSLDKVNISQKELLRKHIERLFPVVIQPKMDGLTIVYYPNTKSFTTRGNGLVGENITDKAPFIQGIGELEDFFNPVRGEVVMLHSEYERIQAKRIAQGLKPFKSIRNAAAGMLRRDDIEQIEGLTCFAYNLLSPGNENNEVLRQMGILKDHGWNIVFSYEPKTVDEAMEFIENFDRTTLDYDIDGLVIKHNGPKKFGDTEHHPNNAIAVKFESQGDWTKIISIVPQVGRTGKIVPVANVEPIDVMGATLSRATLHNYGIVEALDLNSYNSKTEVMLVRSNDVIPSIVKVRHNDEDRDKKVLPPKVCPVCGGEVVKINAQHFCQNPDCYAKALNNLIHFASRDAFNIEGLSEATAEKILEYVTETFNTVLAQMMNAEEAGEFIDPKEYDEIEKILKFHPSFLYILTERDFLKLDNFAEISANKLYNEIQKSKVIDLDKFIYGCGIPLIGKKAARDIAAYYCKNGSSEYGYLNMAEDKFNNFEGLKTVKGIGSETIASFNKFWDSKVVPFGDVRGLVINNIEVVEEAKDAKTFVITGEFEIPRKEIKKLIESKGHKVTGSVSKKTDYLLAAPGEDGTEKYKKAIKYNTTIINSLDKLKEILK